MNCSTNFNLISGEPALIAKCLWGSNVEESVQNTYNFQCTSKRNYALINSEDFKSNFFYLANKICFKNEIFHGAMSCTAFAGKENVEVFSFDSDPIFSFQLNKDLAIKEFKIPQDMRIPSKELYREFPFGDGNEKYVVLNLRQDSAMYLFSRDGSQCLRKYEVHGEICDLKIKNHLLFVIEQLGDGNRQLVVFDLTKDASQEPIKISCPKPERLWPSNKLIYMNDNYIIYSQILDNGDKLYALPLSEIYSTKVISNWIEGEKAQYSCYMLPNGDHFIEVNFSSKSTFAISKVYMTPEGFKKTEIHKNIILTHKQEEYGFRRDVFLQDGRVFFAYENMPKGTTFFSYDLSTNSSDELMSISQYASNFPFKPRFLALKPSDKQKKITKMFYLLMTIGDIIPNSQQPDGSHRVGLISHLTTFTYMKG